MPGVEAVCTAADFPSDVSGDVDTGEVEIGIQFLANLIMGRRKALFEGHPVAAVAATDIHIAEEAARLVKVVYDVLPAVTDPIEAMSLLAAAIVTRSEITITRVPIEFLEIELALLEEMGFVYDRTEEYVAANGHTRLVDITTHPSDLHAPLDKIHPMPFPGLNIDNLPFFAVIAAVATGQTLLHDWVYENRAIYLTELTKLGAQVKLLDPHRVMIEGPTHFSGTEIVCPPALRPAVVILLAMLASKGTSVLRSTYVIARGYEDLAERLNELGAQIEPFRDI